MNKLSPTSMKSSPAVGKIAEGDESSEIRLPGQVPIGASKQSSGTDAGGF